MKKTAKLLIIIICAGIGIAAAGLLLRELSLGGALDSGAFITPGSKDTEYVNESFTGIDELELNINIAEVSFIYSDDDSVRVVQRGGNLSDKMIVTATQSGGVLSVKTPVSVGFNPGKNMRSYVEVSLPRGYSGDVSVNLSLGSLKVREAWQFGDFAAKLSLGEFTSFDDLTAEKAKISVSTGDLKLDRLLSDDFDLGCSLGSIDIGGLRGGGKISNSTGSVKVMNAELTGDLKIDNSLGDISLSLAPGQSIEFYASTSLGEIKSYFTGSADSKTKLEATLGGGEHKLTVKNSTGDIKITQS